MTKAPDLSASRTVTLAVPFEVGGREVTVITLRRPKVRDLRALQRVGSNPLAQSLFLIGRLAELTPDEIDEIDPVDLAVIGGVLEDFTGRAGSPGTDSSSI